MGKLEDLTNDAAMPEAMRDALRAAEKAGWRLVPVEPTPEMIESVRNFGGRKGYSSLRGSVFVDAYKDALQAAPRPWAESDEVESFNG